MAKKSDGRQRMSGTACWRRVALAAALALAAGCGRQPPAAEESGKDYRLLLERSRERNRREQAVRVVRQGVEAFQTDLGRLPTNLLEVVQFGYVEALPELPEGFTYRYNSVLGIVEAAPLNP